MYVVKLGGGEGVDPQPCLDDLAQRWRDGERWVLVHGGSADATELGRRLGLEPRFVTTASGHRSRFTDEATRDVLAMALRGRRNLDLVARLQRLGVNAVGLSGVDGRLVTGPRKDSLVAVEGGRRFVLRGDHSAKVEEVNVGLLRLLLDHEYAPVVTIPVLADDGAVANADGDRVAALVASRLGASTLLVLTDVPGLLRDVSNPATVVPRMHVAEIEPALATATGGMRKKLLAAREGLAGGLERVIFTLSNRPRPVTAGLEGAGTCLVRG